MALALIVFMQNLGGAIFLALAQTIFSRQITDNLENFAPGVNVQTVEAAGATGFRKVISPADLIGVLKAYSLAVSRDFYLAVGCAGATLICCWGMGWVNIKKEKPKTKV